MESPEPTTSPPPRLATIRHVDDRPPPAPWSWGRALRVGALRVVLVGGLPLLLTAEIGTPPAVVLAVGVVALLGFVTAIELRLVAAELGPGPLAGWTVATWLLGAGWLAAASVQRELASAMGRGAPLDAAVAALQERLLRPGAPVEALMSLLTCSAPLAITMWVRLQCRLGLGPRGLAWPACVALGITMAGPLVSLDPLDIATIAMVGVMVSAPLLVLHALIDGIDALLDPPWRYRRPDA